MRKIVVFPGLALLVALSVVTGCEDVEGGASSGFSFDAGFGLVDAAPVGTTDAGTPLPETTLTSTPKALTNEETSTFEFTSDQPGTFACRLDEGTPFECSSPHVLPVQEGVHTFEVSAVAKGGAVDLTPASFRWTVDRTPPKTTVTKGPPATDNSSDVSFVFSATETATFECQLDRAAAGPCTSPFEVSNLSDGAHTLTITAKDGAGNVEAPPARHAWTIDTTTPDTTIDSGPTGTVSAKTAEFRFSSPNAGAGVTFACALDGAAFATCKSPFTKSGLGDGLHSFEVRARDAADNQDITPAKRTWTIDSVSPTVAITAGPTGAVSDTTPTFAFTTGAGATSTQCRIDSRAFAPCTSPFTSAALPQGAHSFTVRAFDAANNLADATRGFSIDTTAPSVTITSGPNGPTNDATPSFAFTTAGGATGTTCRIDGAPFAACASPFTTSALGNGGHTFEVQATDAAGNVGAASRAFTVDTVPPTVTIGTVVDPTNDPTPSFSFTATGATGTTCRIVPNAFAPCASPFTAGSLSDGSHTFEVRAVDGANNAATATRAFVVDTALPSIVINRGPGANTSDTTPTFAFTAGLGAIRTACRFDAEAFVTCASPLTRGAPLGEGAHTFDVRAYDAAGNFANASSAFSVDTTPPRVTITGGPPASRTPTNDRTPTFTFTAVGATRTQCRIDTAAFANCSGSFTSASLPDGPHTFDVLATDAAGNSATASRAFAIDGTPPVITFTSGPSGLVSQLTFTFTFDVTGGADLTTLQCQLDANAWGACTTTSSWTFGGRGFPQGPHAVRVRASDPAGNLGVSADRSFTVDTVAPAVTATGGPDVTYGANATFTFTTDAGATTSCRIITTDRVQVIAPIACAPTSVNMALPQLNGDYYFEVTATDAAGNSRFDWWPFEIWWPIP